MGCDIQLFCEGYLPVRFTGEKHWVNVDRWFRQDGWAEYMLNDHEGFNYTDLTGGVRDYRLFYLLAGVRSSDDEESFPPIARAKGLPKQMDTLIRRYYEEFYEIDFSRETVDCHHASYLTLRELKDSGYGSMMRLRGWVEPQAYQAAVEKLARGERCQLDFEDVKRGERPGLVLQEWEGYLNLNLTRIIEGMEEIKRERNIEKDKEIRIVFWFDN